MYARDASKNGGSPPRALVRMYPYPDFTMPGVRSSTHAAVS